MKKITLKLICIILLAGCKPSYQATYKMQMKDAFINAFKLTYFTKVFYEGFNRPTEIKEKFATDGSGYGEPLLSMEDYALIDSFVASDNKQMYKDSINRIGTVSEGSQGKHVLSYALSKYQSKWLDSLARARYKIYKRKEEEIDY